MSNRIGCASIVLLLGAWALVLLAPAMGDAVRDIGAALAIALVFVAVVLGGAVLLLAVAFARSLLQPAYQPPIVYLVERAPIAPSPLPARRAELAEPYDEIGEFREVA